MGAGSSGSAITGVAVNPRLEYADKEAKDGQHILLDAPSLVKLQPGTVRYRYLTDGLPITKQRVEKPHEGQENLHQKGGYFYHSRLKDYSYAAEQEKEQSWKFCYVYKGAEKTRQKQVYYVFGKGLKTNENGFIEPNYQSPTDQLNETSDKFFKYHGHLYYDVIYLPEDDSFSEIGLKDSIIILGDGKVDNETNEIRILVSEKDKINLLKRKLAIKMHKPAPHFHMYLLNDELQNDDTAQILKPRTDKQKNFTVILKPR